MSRGTEIGQIEYTGRALLQDAQEAMRGDIVRGLVELITNSDDAYARMKNGSGRISVEVEHRRGSPWQVIVRDRATGMSHGELRDRIRRLGARSSGFEEGLEVRGNRGRGAKDLVAFGTVEFKSIQNDRYSEIVLEQDGTYKLHLSRVADKTLRKHLGILRGNGTVVSVTCLPTVRCPLHQNLADQLRCHFQLRDIMSDPDREVILVNLNKPREKEKLRYGISGEALDEVVSERPTVDDYPQADVRLRLWRLPERCEQPRSDPSRPCGVLIAGSRAIYENTLGSFEGNRHAGWYAGRLDCHYIDQLAREYDDRAEAGESHPQENPVPIISRRREGLSPDHPFTKALFALIDNYLKERVNLEENREREEGQGIENASTRRRLHRMAQEAARFLQDAMREIEAENPPLGGPGEVEALQIVPPEVVLRFGEERTLSILAKAEGLEEGQEVRIASEPEGVVDVLDGLSVRLAPHRKRGDLLSAQLHLRPLTEGEVLLTAEVEGREALGLVQVKPSIEDEIEEQEIPETLEFERPRYRIRWNKRKKLTLKAPQELIEEHGRVVRVSSDHPGVVVRGGGAVRLSANPESGIAEARVQLEGRDLGATAKLTAWLGDVEASCRVSVEQRDEGLPDLKIELTTKEPSIYRALFDPPEVSPGEKQRLLVFTRHASLKRFLGEAPHYPGQDEPEWKAVLAEVVTEAVVRRVVTSKYPAAREDVDADQIYYDHFTLAQRLLPLLQRVVAAT